MSYLAFKAAHVIAMVCWFAGLFYMFRLFVYLRENNEDENTRTVLKTMSRKLYYYITCPSMVVTLILGVVLLGKNPGLAGKLWFQIKFGLLLGLFVYNWFIGYTFKRFRDDDYFLTSKQCRMLNEVPVIFLISIVLLAILKPF